MRHGIDITQKLFLRTLPRRITDPFLSQLPEYHARVNSPINIAPHLAFPFLSIERRRRHPKGPDENKSESRTRDRTSRRSRVSAGRLHALIRYDYVREQSLCLYIFEMMHRHISDKFNPHHKFAQPPPPCLEHPSSGRSAHPRLSNSQIANIALKSALYN